MKRIGIILIVIGVIVFGLGGFIYIRERLFLQTAEQATATVTGNVRITYNGNYNEMGTQHYYCSSFQFQTSDGQNISFKETEGEANLPNCSELDMPPDFQPGEQVAVYYDPRDPANTVQIPKYIKDVYSGGVILIVIGLLLLIISMGLFYIGKVRRQ